MNRRGFLFGLGAALAAPAIIRTAGLLMPIKPALVLPELPEIAPVTGMVWRNGLWMNERLLLDVAGRIINPPSVAVDDRPIVKSLRYRSPSMAEYQAGAVPASFRRVS